MKAETHLTDIDFRIPQQVQTPDGRWVFNTPQDWVNAQRIVANATLQWELIQKMRDRGQIGPDEYFDLWNSVTQPRNVVEQLRADAASSIGCLEHPNERLDHLRHRLPRGRYPVLGRP